MHGAVEHAEKLAGHFRDNYPEEAKWLRKLGEMPAAGEDGDGDGGQHARYSKRSKPMAADPGQALDMTGTISGQFTSSGS